MDYVYRTNATPSTLAAWPAGATAYPSNLAMTATGKPYIIRLETGTVNRAIYQITMLHDPLAQPAAPSWNVQSANWNKRLIYTFGGGCIGGWYRQGASTGGVTDDFMLTNGYALASSSLNVFGNNCNDLTAAESMMMVKERFIEAYGPPAHTQGWGCSGGSYAQHQISDNYPGLLEGIIPGCSFPEVGFATINFITDAWLLDTYFNRADIVAWTPEQKRLVTGFMVYNTAPNVAIGARRIDPKPGSTSCNAVPVAQRYDPATNPTGVRCTVYDHTVNVYGRDFATGFARRPLDNVGIQYGLKLVNSGASRPSNFSISTRRSAASTAMPPSCRSARWPTSWRRARRTRPGGSPTAGAAWPRFPSSITAHTTMQCQAATSTFAITRSQCARGLRRRTGGPTTMSWWSRTTASACTTTAARSCSA